MKKIFILFALLPFSLFAELDPTDLDVIEGSLDNIKQSSYLIENDVNEIVNYVSLLTGRTYEIIQGQSATKTEVVKIKSLLTDLNNLVESLKGDLNNYLPLFDSNLQNAVTSLGYCQNYLNDIKNTTSNIYDELSKLGTIAEDLASIKIFLEDKCSFISTVLNDINTSTQNIYDELLSQGYDIKDIHDFLTSEDSVLYNYTFTASGAISNILAPSYSNQKPQPVPMENWSITTVLIQGINYLRSDINKIHVLLANQNFRIYDIQTNFHSSIKIQKDISTNVSYIASIISNMYAKSDNTDITNAYDQASDDYENKIKEDYESKEGELDQYEDKITARNQSFRQNEDLVGQFTTLINSFRCDSLPEVASISIINLKFGDNSALPSTSSIIIDLRRFSICFRAIRCLSAIFYWGIVLILGYKITFIFVKFIRSNVLGIIPSTNKSDDGAFL